MSPEPEHNGNRIRDIRPDDLNAVYQIECVSFASPWSMESFEAELVKTYGLHLISETDEGLNGYIFCWQVEDELHIANLAVAPAWRHHGIAQALVTAAIDKAESLAFVYLEVRESNIAARKLYEKLGFGSMGIRKKYYADNEDAVLMALTLHPKQ